MSTRGARYGLRRAFTLVELLVVIGIIALLIAILLPTLSRARDAAKDVGCASNLRQFGTFMYLYADRNKGWLVPSQMQDFSMWISHLGQRGYGGWTVDIDLKTNPFPFDVSKPGFHVDANRELLYCPHDPQDPAPADSWMITSYTINLRACGTLINPAYPPRKLSSLRGLAILLAEATLVGEFREPPSPPHLWSILSTHHNPRAMNLLYSDGHVVATTDVATLSVREMWPDMP